MDDKLEFQLRRKAIRLWLQGKKQKTILQKIPRSRSWLNKWQQRFKMGDIRRLKSRSRRPIHMPTRYAPRIVRLVIQIRQRLIKHRIGVMGVRAIRRELKHLGLKHDLPAATTIKRILRQHGLVQVTADPTPTYFPKPLTTTTEVLHAMDWTCRYLTEGPKVYAFHSLNLRTRARFQTIALNKNGDTVIGHLLDTWKTLGIPGFLQLDNDAAFYGSYKVPRHFGRLVRLCLYLGIELIFLPVAEPECNGEIEQLNGLWGYAFWERRLFESFASVQRASPSFVKWYMTQYAPPYLGEQTPTQAQRGEDRRRLTRQQIVDFPEHFPITAGRVHFIRRVAPDGTINVFNEPWRISKRLAGKYVWATLTTHCRRLECWYQRSAQHGWRLLKTFDYQLSETTARLNPEFAHRSKD